MVIGEDVVICSETSDREIEVLTRGGCWPWVTTSSWSLEGRPEPVTGGRLVLGPTRGIVLGGGGRESVRTASSPMVARRFGS